MDSATNVHELANAVTDLPSTIRFFTGAAVLALVTLPALILFQHLRKFLRFTRSPNSSKVVDFLKTQGFRGPPFSDVEGNAKEMAELTAKAVSKPLDSITHDIEPRTSAPMYVWRKLYGDNFIFSGPGMVLSFHSSDPKVAREMFSTSKFQRFGKSRVAEFLIDLMGKGGLVFSNDEEWARQRRVVRPAYYISKSKEMASWIASGVDPWLHNLENLAVENGGELEMDVFAKFGGLIKDILARHLFSGNFEKGREVFESQEKLRHLTLQRGMFTNPLFRLLPTRQNIEIWRVKGQVSKSIREIIDARRKSVELGNSKSYGDDLLGLLLAGCENQKLKNLESGEERWTDEDLVDQCRTFFFAGTDTILSVLSWACVLLAHYPKWQENIRAEAKENFLGASPDGDKLAASKLLDMFLDETLRLYPPATQLIRDVRTDNTTVLGKTMPKALTMRLNILGLHRHSEYWGDDALEFKPERFAEGVVKSCKDLYAFMPFGAGPRTCVAQNFALTEAKVVLSMLLQRFSLRLSPSYRHEPVLAITLVPKYGAQLIFKRLNSSDL